MSYKDWLALSIFTLLIVFTWITFDVYHAMTTSTVASVEEELIEPLDPEFDHQVIIEMEERQIK